MKGLKKVALASAIAAVSAGAQAELKALDDATMGELTGQAGLTIDIETSFSIGEFQYRDQDGGEAEENGVGGSILIRGIRQGGNTNAVLYTPTGTVAGGSTLLDNVRLTLDVAGADADDNAGLNYGFSEIGRLTAFLDANGNDDGNIDFNAQVVRDLDNDVAGVAFADFGPQGGTTPVGIADVGVGQWVSPLLGGSFAQDATLREIAPGVIVPIDADGNPAVDATGTPIAAFTSENGSDEAGVEDGDLVLHFGFTDALAAGGGFAAFANGNGASADRTGISLSSLTWAEARDIATRAVDYTFEIDAIALAGSNYAVGSVDQALGQNPDAASADQTTVLISDLSISGYFGPRDIHIENDGNGFGADGSFVDYDGDGANNDGLDTAGNTTGDADSKITISNYFNITNLDVYIDIAGISLEGVEIKNDRGDLTGLDGTSSFGFAHSRQTIFAVEGAVLDLTIGDDVQNGQTIADLGGVRSQYVDGLQLNTEFKGDIDIEALRFGGVGEGESIGQIFLTDIESVSNWTISAHD